MSVPLGENPFLSAPYEISRTFPSASTYPYFPFTSPFADFVSILKLPV